MGSRLSSHAQQPDDLSSDDEILLVAPPPPPLLDRKQLSARTRPSLAKVGTKSATKRTLKDSQQQPPPPESPRRRKRQHTRWTDDTATGGGTIASISHASKVRSAAAAALSSPSQPERQGVPGGAAGPAPASLASKQGPATTATTTSRPTPAPSKSKRKRVRSPSFELEIFNPPPRRRATLSAAIRPATPTSAPPPPPPPRFIPTATTTSAPVAVLAPARSTISPDEPIDDESDRRASPAVKEVPPASSSSSSRSKGVGDCPPSRRANRAVVRPFDLVAPVVKSSQQRTGTSSNSGSTSSQRRPSPPPAGMKALPSSAPTPPAPPASTPLPRFPHKAPSHPLNSSLRLKPTPSEPPPPIPVRYLRNDEFEATRELGGWVLPHPVAAVVATREISLSRPSSRSATPLPATATATQTATKAALSFADWARKRYGFLDPSETSHYKIDGSTLGIDPDVMSYEWDEDELWDAYEERWGWRERERVARGEEGESGTEEEEEDSETYEGDDTDDDDDEGSGSGSEERQKRSSPPPPRARMAFTFAAPAAEEDESGTGEDAAFTHGTEVVARLCHLASAAEGAVHSSDRLSALSQLDAMSRAGAVLQVPWRWKSLEEGQGRASNLAGMVDGKGKWATRNPFMRGTAEGEGQSGRGAHRTAKMAATAAVASMQGAGGSADPRLRAAAAAAAGARRRTLVSSSTSTSSSRASSVDPERTTDVPSAAAAAPARPASAPSNVAAVTSALYGIDETDHAALGSDMTDFDSAPASLLPPVVSAPARQIPHLGTFLSVPSSLPPPSPAPIELPAAAASESSPSSTAMRLETSSEGAAVIRSIHYISNANARSPLLSGGGGPLVASNSERGVATASSTAEAGRVAPTRRSRPEKPPTMVRSTPDGVASVSASRSSSAPTSRAPSSNNNGSSSSSDGDAADSGPTSASSSDPEAGPLSARLAQPPPPPSVPIATVRPLAPPVVPASSRTTAPAARSASGSKAVAPKPSAETTPKKPPTVVKTATTPSGMVRCNHGGCPSPFYHPHKRAAFENHARNFHTPGVILNYRDPDRAHYLARDPNSGALQCPFCSFWSMNASSTRQHVYRRSDCLGPPAQSRAG